MTDQFENNLEIIASVGELTGTQLQAVAQIYSEIIQDISPAVVKAKQAAAILPKGIEGATELVNLLRMMDGSFVTKAKVVIQKAYLEANPEPEPIAPEV